MISSSPSPRINYEHEKRCWLNQTQSKRRNIYKFILADTPLEYSRSFVLGGKKNLQGGGKEKQTGGKNWRRKKEREKNPWRIEPSSRIDLAQESNALPVTYCDSQASL